MVRHSTKRQRSGGRFSRREMVTSGAVFVGVTAGCLGDDGDPVEDADVEDDQDDPTDDDDEPDELERPEVIDATATWAHHGNPEPPAERQYNPYNDLSHPWEFPFRHPPIIPRSLADFQHYPFVAADWSYEPGVLEFTINEDFYWWSGDQVTIDDYILELEFENYLWGGEELDAQPSIVSHDKIDDFTARLTLADAWHEDWAIFETVEGHHISANRHFFEPWVEQFDDAPDLDAVQDLREDHQDHVIEDDEGLVNVFFSPYEFRLDGDLGEVGENHWELELVQEKHGNLRHLANPENFDWLPNFARARYETHEEGDVMQTDRFMEGTQPIAFGQITPGLIDDAVAGELPFETDVINFYRAPSDQGGMQFNHDGHPGDDPHFRRAFAYLTDNTAWEDHPEATPNRKFHPYFSDEMLEVHVSQDVIDAFTDYGYDDMRFDDAEAELVAGGYERDANGNWLMQEDGPEGDAGEPMEFTMGTWSWMEYVADHGTDWLADLESFGIGIEVLLELPEDWTILWTYTGGGTPEHAIGNVFLDMDWARADFNIPSVVLAPPFLETEDAPADPENWVEYEVTSMTDRLPVTIDQEMHQQLVDQLTWVLNQNCHHYGVAPISGHHALNLDSWDFASLEEAPSQYTAYMFRSLHFGICQARPETDG